MAHQRLTLRLPNWVGDVCMALPALDALRAAGAEVSAFGRAWCTDLLCAHPVATAALPRGLWAAARALRNAGSRHVLLLPGSFSSAAAAWLAGLRAIGYAGDWRGLLLAHRIAPLPGIPHESQRFRHLARAAAALLGLDLAIFDATPTQPRLVLPAAPNPAVAAVISGLSRPWVVLCPLATGTVGGRDKRWPGFTTISEQLRRDGITCVCCPGPGEEDACRRLLPSTRLLPGLVLSEYAAVLRAADGVLANDSGPLHLAAAAGGRVLGIYGVSDPARYGPLGGATVGGAEGWPDPGTVRDRLRQVMTRAAAGVPPGGAGGSPS